MNWARPCSSAASMGSCLQRTDTDCEIKRQEEGEGGNNLPENVLIKGGEKLYTKYSTQGRGKTLQKTSYHWEGQNSTANMLSIIHQVQIKKKFLAENCVFCSKQSELCYNNVTPFADSMLELVVLWIDSIRTEQMMNSQFTR